MKLIDNCTDLSNTEIGMLIDEISKDIDTIYYGKEDYLEFKYKDRLIAVYIKYLKKYVKFVFYELKDSDK